MNHSIFPPFQKTQTVIQMKNRGHRTTNVSSPMYLMVIRRVEPTPDITSSNNNTPPFMDSITSITSVREDALQFWCCQAGVMGGRRRVQKSATKGCDRCIL